MSGRNPFASITPDDLRMIAREAASEHMVEGTPLTDAVVKAASAFGNPLTSEHVRRVCEMTYHDTFERKFHEAGGADRYISFDPPDAVEAATRLNAEKVASAQTRQRAQSMNASLTEKVAHVTNATRRYQRVNAFDELVKTAEDPKVNWYNPLGEISYVRDQLKEAKKDLTTQYSTVDDCEKFAMMELEAQAYQTYKDGTSAAGILHSCVSSVKTADYSPEVIAQLTEDLAHRLANLGCALDSEKVAMFGTPNLNHPLPKAFKKVAEFRNQRVHLELALSDIVSQMERVNEELHALCS